MNWSYKGKELTTPPEGYVGFVYEITDNVNGKIYVGKKLFYFTKTLPPLKGTKRRRKVVSESDWRSYYGSNPTIKAIIAKEGPGRFTRKIIHLCINKSEMSYIETKEIIEREAIFSPSYYNQLLDVKVGARGLAHLSREALTVRES